MKRLLPVALLLVAIALFAWWWFGTVGAPNPPAVPTAGGSEGHTRSEPPAPGARPATAVQQPDAPPPSNDDQDQDDADHESTELLHEALDEEDFDVVCRIEPALREAEAYLAVGEPDSLDGRRVRVLMGHALVPLLEGPGEGWLSVAGYAPTPVSWGEATPEDPASCEPDPVVLEPGSAAITGVVRHQEGGRPARKAWVEGCGGMSMTDEEGAYFMTVVPGPCRVLALRSDGMLHTRGPAVDVVAREGTDLVVDLEIPGFRKAGLGAQVRQVDEGMVVDRVLEGSAAHDMGLQAGDLIVSVDGTATVELELSEFVEAVSGTEGTSMVLQVERGEVQMLMVIERRIVEEPTPP